MTPKNRSAEQAPSTELAYETLRSLFDEAMCRSLIPFGESHEMRRQFEEAVAALARAEADRG